MPNTLITTATETTVNLGANEFLAVTASGSIFNPNGAVITGFNATGQGVTIAGYVELQYIWLGGSNTVNITETGVFYGHGGGTNIYLGIDGAGSAVHGGSILNNAGVIQSDANGITMFGESNQINNSGTISAEYVAVNFTSGLTSILVNSGSITSRAGNAVLLGDPGDMLVNHGTILSQAHSAVVADGNGMQIENSGTIIGRSGTGDYAMNLSGASMRLTNDGLIDAVSGSGVFVQGGETEIVNTGAIRAGFGVIVMTQSSGVLVNSGEITSLFSTAITSDEFNTSDTMRIINSGTITGITNAIITDEGQTFLTNTGTINGNVLLGAGDDRFDNRGGIINGVVAGGDGSDSYFTDDADLVIAESELGTGVDWLYSKVSIALSANVENLVLLGGQNITGTGTANANAISGNSGDNRLSGLAGNDTIDGGTGDDRLLGNAGADALNGGAGDDSLNGGVGRDQMSGGDGDDRYVLTSVQHTARNADQADRILDFVQGEDRIDLSAIDAKSTNANPDDAFVFIGAGAFTSAQGQLGFTVNTIKHQTLVRMDVNGDGITDAMLRLDGDYNLTAADFLL